MRDQENPGLQIERHGILILVARVLGLPSGVRDGYYFAVLCRAFVGHCFSGVHPVCHAERQGRSLFPLVTAA